MRITRIFSKFFARRKTAPPPSTRAPVTLEHFESARQLGDMGEEDDSRQPLINGTADAAQPWTPRTGEPRRGKYF